MRVGPHTNNPRSTRMFQLFIICKRTNNANNATHYVELGKKRRESSKRNYYVQARISPGVIINAIIIRQLFRRDSRRAGGKRQLARCSRKPKIEDTFVIASKAKKLLHRCIGAHAQVHVHSCGEYACIATGVVSTMHVQVYTLNRCCEHQRTHLRTRSSQGVHMHSCMRSVFIQRWEQRVRGLSWSMSTLVAWRGELFMTEEKIGKLSVSLFLTRVGVYVGVSVCTRIHTRTLHI